MRYNTQELINILTAVAASARTGDYGKAASDLNRALIMAQSALSSGKIPPEGLSRITFSLQTLFAMQQNGDWVAFADILEYEFTGLWKSLVQEKD
ncbi:MAG: hypothetical protein GX556_12095 [Fibrobacter sp.]|nr:hypothetical protein [Fibrobacter sp.]